MAFDKKEYDKLYSKENKRKQYRKEYHKKWKEKNPEYHKVYSQTYSLNTNYFKEWKEKNPEYFKEYQKNNLNDPLKNLKHRMRCVIGQCFKRLNNNKKSNNTLSIIGLESWDKFREHIEKQFSEDMNWENYGVGKNNTTWHIDHIIPISSVITKKDILKLNHYSNLRPMWGSDNILKSNK
jgi:hypothetical protein